MYQLINLENNRLIARHESGEALCEHAEKLGLEAYGVEPARLQDDASVEELASVDDPPSLRYNRGFHSNSNLENTMTEDTKAPTYPGENASVKVIWDTCESFYQDGNGQKPTFKIVRPAIPADVELADSTVRTQIQRWRQYRGLTTQRTASAA